MIYLHIPFCRTFCTYCGFYSEILSGDQSFDRFVDAIQNELRHRDLSLVKSVSDNLPSSVSQEFPRTMYIGGGTPSMLPLSVLENILKTLSDTGIDTSFTEFTIEVNPDDVVLRGRDYVEGLIKLGVNRISMGIQSFDDTILKWMRRRHDSATAVKAYKIIKESGIDNISIDLIFGISILTSDLWRETIERALSLPYGRPQHISAYQLSIECGSTLEEMCRSGKYSEASEEECASQYMILCDALRRAGYEHYEISNFALPGRKAIHNSAYWSGSSYLGLGPGAHSYDSVSKIRSWNRPSLKEYVDVVDFDTIRESEKLTVEQTETEQIMLSLRTSKGIKRQNLENHSGYETVAKMIFEGDLVPCGDMVRIPEERFFVSDSIISALI